MTTNYKVQQNQPRNILTKNLTCITPINYVKLIIFYKNVKQKILFIRNSPKLTEKLTSCVATRK